MQPASLGDRLPGRDALDRPEDVEARLAAVAAVEVGGVLLGGEA